MAGNLFGMPTVRSRNTLNILIVGAGICGPAVAMLLQRSNPAHKITIVERSASLRSTGQQVDLKTQAPHILKKMGLMEEIKARCVNETGVEIVNSKGKRIALFGATASGQRSPGLTSEHEIMRGDMVQVLYDASVKQDTELRNKSDTREGGVTYEFGQTITALSQDVDGVDATFLDGQTKRYDLVIGADGQASRTRRLAFGRDVSDAAFKSLGIHGAFFSIPRIESEETLAKAHLARGRTMIFTRTSGRPVTGVLFFTMKKSPELKGCYKESIDSQKTTFSKILKECDWQTERLLDGLNSSTDFYANELGQIKMDKLSTGRVVLLGDAGYCPSPFTGLGTNLCLVGAYVLAGELARQDNDVVGALRAYEERMRPFINECQKISPRTLSLFFPSSRFGVWSMHQLIRAVSRVNRVFSPSQSQTQQEDSHWKQLPLYPELNLAS